MAGITTKSLSSPYEIRTPEKTKVDVVALGAAKETRFTMAPGWRWSDCIKPVFAPSGASMAGDREPNGSVFSKRPPWNLSCKNR